MPEVIDREEELRGLYEEFKHLAGEQERAARAEAIARSQLEVLDLHGRFKDSERYARAVARWHERHKRLKAINQRLGANNQARSLLLQERTNSHCVWRELTEDRQEHLQREMDTEGREQ